MRKHLAIILPGLLALVLFGVVTFAFVVPHTREVLISQKRESLRRIVVSVSSLLESYDAQVKAGLIDSDVARERALFRISTMRTGSDSQDYFWINDLSPRMLINPYAKKLVGKDLGDYRDSKGQLVFKNIVDLVKNRGEGFVNYNWYLDGDPQTDGEKISFVKLFEPWGWVVGTGNYLADVNAEVAQLTKNLIWAGFAVFALITSVTLYLIAKSMSSEKARNKSLEELKKSEEKYRDLFNSALEGIFLIKDDMIRDINPSAEEMLGYNRKELLGKSPLYLTPQWQAPGLTSQVFYDQYKEIITATGSHSFELLMLHKNGREVPTEVSISKTEHAEGMYLALVKDISQRKKAEKDRQTLQGQLQKAQKMEAIGTLAGGIAHDFNNILTVIQGNAEVAKLRLEKPKYKPAKQLEEIIGAARRAKDLVKQILSYSRQAEIEKQCVDIKEILNETVMMLRRTTMRTVGIKLSCSEEHVLVKGNSTQLQQVILNIANNSIQAMKSINATPLLRISLDSEKQNNESNKEVRGSDRCLITFKDNGEGMHPDQVERAFDPFFTTKPVGEGTGLGLSVVYGIVKDHGGEINITSQKNMGTEMTVVLPLLSEKECKQNNVFI